MQIENIEKIELEISSDCNAACPGCARTLNLDKLNIQNLSITQIKNWFPTRNYIENKIFKLCGVLGDPIVNPDCFDITKWLLQNGGKVQYSTNGGRNSADWWFNLGKLGAEFDNKLDINFCVDGVETNYMYRVNTKYEIIDRNMQAYHDGAKSSNKKAKATWIYIVFDHNEHEIEVAKNRATELQFKFATRTGMRNSFDNWVAQIAKKDKAENKIVIDKKIITTTGNKQHSKVETVKELDHFIEKYKQNTNNITDESITQILDTIDCKFYHGNELFVASNGTLWPCCYLWDSNFVNKENIREKYSSFDSDWNALDKKTINEILQSDFYKTVLQDSWNPKHNKHISRCIRTCGKRGAYQNEIKFHD